MFDCCVKSIYVCIGIIVGFLYDNAEFLQVKMVLPLSCVF